MPCRRSHHTSATAKGSSTAQTTVNVTTPTTIPALTGPRPRPAASVTHAAAATVIVAPRTMRVAVISDVHANRHALDAVLVAVDEADVAAVWCLGDTVGYGPQPNECCDLVRGRADVCLVGNHDLVVLGALTVSDFNDEAAAAALWTSGVLSEESRRFLAGLKPTAEAD